MNSNEDYESESEILLREELVDTCKSCYKEVLQYLKIENHRHNHRCSDCLRKSSQNTDNKLIQFCKVHKRNSFDYNFAIDTQINQGKKSSNLNLFSCIQDETGWNTRLTRELPSGQKHYIEFKIDKSKLDAIIVGFSIAKETSKLINGHIGEKNNGSYGFYIWNNSNYTTYYGDERDRKLSNSFKMSGDLNARSVGLLLDTDPTSNYYKTISLFWNCKPGEKMNYKGILMENIPDGIYRAGVSLYSEGDTISWRGYSEQNIPEHIVSALDP